MNNKPEEPIYIRDLDYAAKPTWNTKKRALRLVLSVSILLLGLTGTIFASFMLKYDAAWLSVLAIGIGATVKGALMIDNYL